MGKETYQLRQTCNECPWRKDVEPGRFPPERFYTLARTARQGWGNPIFACHKTIEGKDQACVGFLLVEGWNNFSVRWALAQRWFDPRDLKAAAPLYESYAEMAKVNGVEGIE